MNTIKPIDVRVAAQTARLRAEKKRCEDGVLEKEARADLARILKLIVDKFHPQRIYQWGSLTHAGRFRGYSDIDLALEGILDPEQYFRLLGEVQGMTRFPVDIVQLEKIMPEYAEDIREKGVLLYEHA